MKKLLLLFLCSPMVILAAGVTTPAKTPAAASITNKTEAKTEEKKGEEPKKQITFMEEIKELYKSTEKTRAEFKNKALTYYNDTTNSSYFQIGKCTVAGLLIYYGGKQFKSFTLPQQNARMGEFEIGLNPFAEARPLAIFDFVKSRRNFQTWCNDPITKAGIKMLVGNLLLTKQVMEGVSLYQKAVKRYL